MIVIVQEWNYDPDKFGLPVRQDTRHFIFFIIQIDQSLGYDLLIFQGERIRVIKISGNGCLGEICIFCNIIKCYIFFSFYYFLLSGRACAGRKRLSCRCSPEAASCLKYTQILLLSIAENKNKDNK